MGADMGTGAGTGTGMGTGTVDAENMPASCLARSANMACTFELNAFDCSGLEGR